MKKKELLLRKLTVSCHLVDGGLEAFALWDGRLLLLRLPFAERTLPPFLRWQ